MNILELPSEIIHQIVSYLPNVNSCTKTISTLSQTCKEFYQQLSPLLFETLRLSGEIDCLPSLTETSPNLKTNLLQYAQDLSIDLDAEFPLKFDSFLRLRSLTIGFISESLNPKQYIPSIRSVKQCTNLETLQLYNIEFEALTLESLGNICQSLESLATLEIEFFLSKSEGLRDSIRLFGDGLKSLSKLHSFSFATYQVDWHNTTILSLPDLFDSLSHVISLKYFKTRDVPLMDTISYEAFARFIRNSSLQSITLDGMQISNNVLRSIISCESLINLSLKSVITAYQELLIIFKESKKLPASMNIECSKVFPGVYRFPIFDFIGLHSLTLSVADSAFHSQILTRLIECPTLKELRCDFNSDSGNFALSELVLKSKSLEKLTLYGRCGNSPEVFGNVKSSKFVKSFEFDLSIVSHDKHEITEILRESTLLEEVTVIITEFTDFDLHDTILIPMRERTEASKLERVSLKISLENMLLCKFNSKDRSSVVAEVLGGCWNNNVITGIFKRWNEKDFMVDRLSLDQLSVAELREFEDWFRLKLGKGIKIGFKDGSQCLWLDEK